MQKVGKAIKPHFKADSLTFAVQVIYTVRDCVSAIAHHILKHHMVD